MLSEREGEVLRGIHRKKETTGEILHLSPSTVKFYYAKLLEKNDCTNRTELFFKLLKKGIYDGVIDLGEFNRLGKFESKRYKVKLERIDQMLSIEEINKLKAENDRLKEEIKEYKKRSKCAWKCFEGTLCEEGEKYKACLQEIKEIAERKITYIDFRKSKSWAELEQDYARINYELEQKIFEILQKITKAEEQ